MAGSEYNTKREYQNQGIGGRLLVESMELAKQQDYKGILICGVPTYYPKFGFKTADTFGKTMPDGSNFEAFMGYELQKNALSDHKGKFYEPQSLCCDIHDVEYMRQLEELHKKLSIYGEESVARTVEIKYITGYHSPYHTISSGPGT